MVIYNVAEKERGGLFCDHKERGGCDHIVHPFKFCDHKAKT